MFFLSCFFNGLNIKQQIRKYTTNCSCFFCFDYQSTNKQHKENSVAKLLCNKQIPHK